MQRGVIIKGIGGFYYVNTGDGVIECKARGKFRKNTLVPTVGDEVDVLLSENDSGKGSIEKIHPRKTELLRPAVANVDQIIIVTAVCSPEPNLLLLDKLLITAEAKNINTILCINKMDLDEDGSLFKHLYSIYTCAGYEVIGTSCRTLEGFDDLNKKLKGRITVFAGNSGVGKSSLLNMIDSRFAAQTGEVSKKIQRGKHTTRHVELFDLKNEGYVVDTPGFSSMDLTGITAQELDSLFREFSEYVPLCRFRGCSHISEPDCAVVQAVEKKKIFPSRYGSYVELYNQLKAIKEWKK